MASATLSISSIWRPQSVMKILSKFYENSIISPRETESGPEMSFPLRSKCLNLFWFDLHPEAKIDKQPFVSLLLLRSKDVIFPYEITVLRFFRPEFSILLFFSEIPEIAIYFTSFFKISEKNSYSHLESI